jgi:hypothetical protein
MEKNKVIIENKAKCLICLDILQSKHRHDFVSCTCGNLAVDGGTTMVRRLFRNLADYEELSTFEH